MSRTPNAPNRMKRGGAAPWLVASLGIVLSFTLVRSFRRGSPDWLPHWVTEWTSAGGAAATVSDLRGPEADTLSGWRGTADLGEAQLALLLVPYHAFPLVEEYRSARLRERLELDAGALFRLVVRHAGTEGPGLRIDGFRVEDGGEVVLRDLGSLTDADDRAVAAVPLLRLYARAGAELVPGARSQLVAWGTAPGPGARAVLRVSELPQPGAPDAGALSEELVLELEAAEFRWDELPRSLVAAAERADDSAADLHERVADLEDALATERERVERLEEQRHERELEILGFQRAIANMPLSADVPGTERDAPEDAAATEPAEVGPATPEELRAARERERAHEIAASIRALFKLEGLFALDLLEVGELLPGAEDAPAFGIGPVIFRTVDARGRLTGSLYAKRLHLEGSRAARTLTIVLSEGYESHQRVRTPFAGDERRISLPFVDPGPWRERVPELFSPASLVEADDDGEWDLDALRRELNSLLGSTSKGGWYRLHGIGGVRGRTLNDVHVEDFDSGGYRERRIFADRLRLRVDDDSVTLLFEGGAVHDSAGVHPFRDGFYSIYLPGADPEAWRAADLPLVVGGEGR